MHILEILFLATEIKTIIQILSVIPLSHGSVIIFKSM